MKRTTISGLTLNMAEMVKEQTFQGRAYYVVPAVMMCEGVHNGIFYSSEALSKFAPGWNTKPIVIQHTRDQAGNALAAGDPKLLEEQGVGLCFNTRFDFSSKKLKTDCWLEKETLPITSPEIHEALKSGQMVEVSIGVFCNVELEEGKWNDESFHGIAKNLVPDHLALLPDRKGSCSIADGAGLLRENELKEQNQPQEKHHMSLTSLKRYLCSILSPIRNTDLVENEKSIREKSDLIQKAIRSRFLTKDADIYTVDIFEDNVVFEQYDGRQSQLFRIDYSINKTGEVQLGASAEPVKVETNYVAMKSAPALNEQSGAAGVSASQPVNNENKTETAPASGATTAKESNMDRKQKVDALIQNGAANEEQRTALMEMGDVAFDATSFLLNAQKRVPTHTPAPVQAPAAPAMATRQDILQNAAIPEELKAQVKAGLEMFDAARTQMIAGLAVNSAHGMSK